MFHCQRARSRPRGRRLYRSSTGTITNAEYNIPMNDISKDDILSIITRFYLESHDFNGIPAMTLATLRDVKWSKLRSVLRHLIKNDLVGILYGDDELNVHIVRRGFLPNEKQIEKLGTNELHQACIYPRPKHLEQVVDRARYSGEPYKLCLALGEPQLFHRSFDLSVLEFYRNDPRYIYQTNDIGGRISLQNTEGMPEYDQVLLQTFGFSYDTKYTRAVAVYLRYLAHLSPEHQRIWQTKELAGDFRLHPDYYRHTIIGEWGGGISIFTALLKELNLINKMADAIGRPPLFREDFGGEDAKRPPKFAFLVRPTLEEFNAFVLLLDKLLSDNINKKFFQGEVDEETEKERNDGKIEVRPKGTLQILNDWLRKYYHAADWSPWDTAYAQLRKVRKMRQQPAHAMDENIFDQRYFKEQRQLIIETYEALRTLRYMLSDHPAVEAAAIKLPHGLEKGPIWTQ